MRQSFFLTALLFCFGFFCLQGQTLNADFVVVESFDEKGTFISKGIGVIQKNGYVLCNYHLVAGGRKIKVSFPGNAQSWNSDGYLSVSESKDIVVLSVPELKGRPVPMFRLFEIPKNSEIIFAQIGSSNSLSLKRAITKDNKEILETQLIEAISTETDECISGPVFYKGELAGFVTAGYYDGKYFLYVIPIKYLFSLIGASFIIKTFESFDDENPIVRSRFQSSLLDMINRVIWMPIEDAIRLAKKNKRKVLVNVCTNWNGWCNMMDNQVFNQKSIIKFINENYYAVHLNAESKDSIWYQGRMFTYSNEHRCHELAYSLLGGKLNYPGTVFLDEEINLLTVVPGFIDERKMKIALHYFKEEAYRKQGMTFETYEATFRFGED